MINIIGLHTSPHAEDCMFKSMPCIECSCGLPNAETNTRAKIAGSTDSLLGAGDDFIDRLSEIMRDQGASAEIKLNYIDDLLFEAGIQGS
jgi:hypothetical protein